MTAAETIAKAIANGEIPRPFSYERYRANIEKIESAGYGKRGYGCSQTECCAYCGKLTLNPKFFAFLTCGSEFDLYEKATDDQGAYNGILGFYPLGSDCARRLKRTVPVYASCGDDEKETGSEWHPAKLVS